MRSSGATDDWEEALITGNGRQGALYYGRPGTLRVTLAHEQLFLPVDAPLPAPHTAPILPELRAALLAGDGRTAARQVVSVAAAGDPGFARLRKIDPFIGAATLTVTGLPVGAYTRGTHQATGVVWQESAGLRSECFVSRAHDVVVLRLRATHTPIQLRLTGLPGTPPAPLRLSRHSRPGRLLLTARSGPTWGYAVGALLRTTSPDPALAPHTSAPTPAPHTAGAARAPHTTAPAPAPAPAPDATLTTWPTVTADRDLLILLRTTPLPGDLHDLGVVGVVAGGMTPTTPRSLAADARAAALAEELLAELAELPGDWDTLLAAHERLHRPLIEACTLRLDDREPEARRPGPGVDGPGAQDGAVTAEELLARPGSAATVAAQFAAGRYAIISASGERPPTLQGVWSGTYRPAWESGYTLDGNLFTALAALAPTGTPELLMPLFDLLDHYRDDFTENARRLYGASGVLLPPHVSSHGRHNHFDATWCLTFWTAGAAWAGRLYAEYAEHTGDGRFWRERALPFLRLARDFERDFAPDGRFVPSYSPENTPAGTGSQAAVNATLDVAAARALRADLGEADTGLPGYTVAADGTLDEWLWPGLAPEHAHRHASHLFGLWYPDPALLSDPALVAAARATVRARLAWWRRNGDEMAFGLTGLGLAAAELGMADECAEILTLLSGYWRPSLVATHNRGEIFNVDSCGGLPAMVVRMLLRPGPVPRAGTDPELTLDLLAALPASWHSGELRGASAGRVRVPRLAWSPGRLEVSLCARVDTRLRLGVPAGFDPPDPFELPAREVVDVCLVSRKTNSHALPPSAGTS